MKNKVYIITLMLVLSMFVSSVALAKPQSYNFNFIDEDIRVVLHTLAKISDVDMIIDDSIKGNITIRMSNVTFDKAIDLITSAKGLGYRKSDNSFIIESADLGMTTVTKLEYTRAVDIKKTIEPIANTLKLKMEIDEVSNSIIVSGSPAGCARIKEILKSVDVLEQQVTIEAKVIAINKTNLKNLGLEWSWDAAPINPEYTITGPVYDPATGALTAYPKTTVTHKASNGFLLFGHNPDGIPYQFNFSTKINALVTNGNAKILASPKVTTVNGKEARVFIGDHIPVLTESISNGATTTTITYVDAGIKLLYTPSITGDGTITAKVKTEVSTPTLITSINNYKITTREAETTVCMKDGETMVIAGLIGSDESKGGSKTPFLGDLPLLGALFKNSTNTKSETEVVIFLTAKINK